MSSVIKLAVPVTDHTSVYLSQSIFLGKDRFVRDFFPFNLRSIDPGCYDRKAMYSLLA